MTCDANDTEMSNRGEKGLQQLGALDNLVHHHLGSLAFASAAIVLAMSLVGTSWFGLNAWRVASANEALENMHAKITWQYETFDLKRGKRPSRLAKSLANWLGGPLVSDIAKIQIVSGNPDDDQLAFLSTMRDLHTLDLRSSEATDSTIDQICRLPRLRSLTLVGHKFSVLGLLKLRQIPTLENLRLDVDRFSAMEMALLRTELKSVLLANAEAPGRPYQDPQPMFAPAV